MQLSSLKIGVDKFFIAKSFGNIFFVRRINELSSTNINLVLNQQKLIGNTAKKFYNLNKFH
jgi:hypothetical protein